MFKRLENYDCVWPISEWQPLLRFNRLLTCRNLESVCCNFSFFMSSQISQFFKWKLYFYTDNKFRNDRYRMSESSSSNGSPGCFGPTLPLNATREAGLNIKKIKIKKWNYAEPARPWRTVKSRSGRIWMSTEVNLVFGSTFFLKVIVDSWSCGWEDENWESSG